MPFLHPPEKVLEAEFSGGVDGNPGRVLLDERHRQCIFVKGVLVDKSGTDTDIFFGVDILFPVKISRDRVGLEDQDELAEAVFRIWQALIKVSEEARRMYLDLLQNHPYALETANAASYLKKPEAQLLFQQLRKDKGDGVFFYTNKDGGEALRIIDHVLKKKAHLIPERLHQSWLKHDIIKTPNQARLDVFRNLQSSERYRDCSSQSQYTAHILKAFLDIIPEMNPCRDAFSFRKADPDIGVEIIPDKGKFLLHDLTLSSVYVHRSKSYEICPRYRQYQGRFGGVAQDPAARETGDQQSGHNSDEMVTLTNEFWPTIPADCVCDCSALHVLYLLIQELNHVSELQKSELNRQIQIYLRSLPRDLQFDLVPSSTQIFDDVSLDFILSWSTDDNLSDFTVYIHAVEHASTRLTNCQTAPHEIRADNDDEFTELSFPSPTNKLILNDLIPSGRNYSAQVVWKKHRAIFSPPFLFTVPPRPPSSTTVKIQRDGTTIFASWEAAPDTGADSWVVIISEEAGELIRKTVSEPAVKLKLFGSPADIDPLELTLRIYARVSRDDIRSPNCALVQVEAVPNYDAHSFFDGFNSFFGPSGSTSTPVHTSTSSRPARTTVEEIDDSEASESWKYSARMNSGSAKKSQEDRGSDQNTSFSILGRESSGQTPGPLQAATEPATHSTAPRVSPTPSSPGLEYYDSPQPQDDSGLGFGSDDDNDMVGIHSSDHNNEAMEFEGFDDRPAVPVPSDRIAIDEGISFADDTALDIPGPVLEWPVQFPPPMSTEMNFEELELDGPKTTKIIQRQKVHVGKHYNVVLKGLDDLAFSGRIQIRSIKAFEHTSSGEYVFLITLYVYQPW
ncbi:hypothetical protein C8J56DRAFT_17378 [Mycena floridula]|nr:hypothetical protein C8J56DRAFT_17378 [Mycena floridula]